MINAIQMLIMPVSIDTSDALRVERHEQDIKEAQAVLQDALQAGYTIQEALPFVTGDTAFVWMLLVQNVKAASSDTTIGYPDLLSAKLIKNPYIDAVSDKILTFEDSAGIIPMQPKATASPNDPDSPLFNMGFKDYLITGD